MSTYVDYFENPYRYLTGYGIARRIPNLIELEINSNTHRFDFEELDAIRNCLTDIFIEHCFDIDMLTTKHAKDATLLEIKDGNQSYTHIAIPIPIQSNMVKRTYVTQHMWHSLFCEYDMLFVLNDLSRNCEILVQTKGHKSLHKLRDTFLIPVVKNSIDRCWNQNEYELTQKRLQAIKNGSLTF